MTPGLIETNEMAKSILLNIRIPRVIAAIFLGMSLAAAGSVMQMLFGNPLVNPGFLGVSQGAAFGAAVCLLYWGSVSWKIQFSASVFACLGLFISYIIAWRIHFGSWVLRLVLSGISVSAIFSALIGILKYSADPTHQLAEITFWLLGGLSSVTWDEVLRISPVVITSLLIIFFFRWRLNILSLKEVTAFSLGSSANIERAFFLVVAVLATAAVTSVSGLVGWIGLIVPHLSRRIFGADARFSLPGSMILGGVLVLVCDDLCRICFPSEIPLGIMTSLVGASFFLILMMTNKKMLSKG